MANSIITTEVGSTETESGPISIREDKYTRYPSQDFTFRYAVLRHRTGVRLESAVLDAAKFVEANNIPVFSTFGHARWVIAPQDLPEGDLGEFVKTKASVIQNEDNIIGRNKSYAPDHYGDHLAYMAVTSTDRPDPEIAIARRRGYLTATPKR